MECDKISLGQSKWHSTLPCPNVYQIHYSNSSNWKSPFDECILYELDDNDCFYYCKQWFCTLDWRSMRNFENLKQLWKMTPQVGNDTTGNWNRNCLLGFRVYIHVCIYTCILWFNRQVYFWPADCVHGFGSLANTHKRVLVNNNRPFVLPHIHLYLLRRHEWPSHFAPPWPKSEGSSQNALDIYKPSPWKRQSRPWTWQGWTEKWSHAIGALKIVTVLSQHAASSSKQPGFHDGLRCYLCSEYGSCGHASFRIWTRRGSCCQ